MSIPVPLDDLRAAVERYGDRPFLLTVGDDGRAHATSCPVRWDGASLVASTGRRTTANARLRPAVAVLWPPVEPGDYSLIVDAAASSEAGAVGEVRLRPERAVLHRSGPSSDPSSTCGSDCIPLATTETP